MGDVLTKKQQYKLAEYAAILRWGSLADSPIVDPKVLLVDRNADNAWVTHCRIYENLRAGSKELPEWLLNVVLKARPDGELCRWDGLSCDELKPIATALWQKAIEMLDE